MEEALALGYLGLSKLVYIQYMIINLVNFLNALSEDLFYLLRVDRNKYQIHIPLPPKIDPTVTMMQVRRYGREKEWHDFEYNCIHLKKF